MLVATLGTVPDVIHAATRAGDTRIDASRGRHRFASSQREKVVFQLKNRSYSSVCAATRSLRSTTRAIVHVAGGFLLAQPFQDCVLIPRAILKRIVPDFPHSTYCHSQN